MIIMAIMQIIMSKDFIIVIVTLLFQKEKLFLKKNFKYNNKHNLFFYNK